MSACSKVLFGILLWTFLTCEHPGTKNMQLLLLMPLGVDPLIHLTTVVYKYIPAVQGSCSTLQFESIHKADIHFIYKLM